MKISINKIALAALTLFMVTSGYSRRDMNSNKGGGNPTPAAGCASAVDIAVLKLNNVRTRIEGTGGSMWQDRANSVADYEVPKRTSNDDPKYTSIYAGALWMGGQDINGQLKLAAVTFRNAGNDFWPGPLNPTTAEITASECAAFDRSWGISRAQVDKFIAWYDCVQDPNCDENVEFPGYSIPKVIEEWPAKGNTVVNGGYSYTVTQELAPFYDKDGDDYYDPNSGDYPKYDVLGEIDCRTTRDVRLFGDTTIWFVFNDKGNTHSETQGPSIGMEIRGQAFAFATNDEVNNMTFYNYEMINRSTFTLYETYFGQWVDSDLGGSTDDYVGCDAQRGLGYCYNGNEVDNGGNGVTGYGSVPPCIGVDFFEGPYADDDGIDNPLSTNVPYALANGGIPYKGLGIGYGDSIVDNERYGMRKFVYYSIGGGQFFGDGDPQNALDYYNYLRGRWRNGGAHMVWGGNGNAASSGGTVLADLLFPGDSDPLFWSTQGISAAPAIWTEASAGNQPGDRRFLESAGPFTLEPGAVNDLTVGVVWARAVSGDNLSSINVMRVADDKAQALFDNCFKIAEGPDAPDLTFQEMENELIIYLSNRKVSNNYNESYNQKNPFIAIPDTLDGVYQGSDEDKDTLKFYTFQGYQIYQMKNGLITASELDDPNKARLVAQVDLKDGITQLVNYTFDQDLQANVPKEMVNGADLGIKHSFRITEDLFASGSSRLVNHKTYYYMAIAYGYNEYKHYDPLDPMALDGQTQPYIASRKLAGGQGLRSFSAIPHNPAPENGGTVANAEYGDQPMIKRIEGEGNNGNFLELTAESEAAIVANNFADYPVYKSGHGPIDVKVVDPLNVKAGVYRVQFQDTTGGKMDDAYWLLHTPRGEIISSDQVIAIENEQLFLDDGLSITVKQKAKPGVEKELGNGFIGAEIEYADSTKRWLGGFSDQEGQTDANWIRSGDSDYDDSSPSAFNDNNAPNYIDPESDFEGLISGTWAPYGLVSYLQTSSLTSEPDMQDAIGYDGLSGLAVRNSYLDSVPSVDIVFTSDKSKWSRCIVFEARNDVVLAEGGAAHLNPRKSPSVDKNGNPDGTGNGMGWFPGYAINVETGERLNVAFAEDSWLAGENGRDMKWNPTSVAFAGFNSQLMMGGKHYVYVFKKGNYYNGTAVMPAYDGCAALATKMNSSVLDKTKAWTTCVWAGIPMLEEGHTLFETDAKVKLRVERPFRRFATASTVNNQLPMYEFDMSGLEVDTGVTAAMDSVLAMINVVPNPYYAYSEYETDQLDNRIKITNLPEVCTISIYNVSGTLMRRFKKGDPSTSLDWDLKNHINVPVASGLYLIHVQVPDIGERTLKWYGIMKPTDLNGF
ncbi:MAG: T9SS C-terminal target domain-containing protein [Flavobacteriales bacterium]|nr:T9SS C-terminal target domain-containing protein [Flavobacteriales bacterium]